MPAHVLCLHGLAVKPSTTDGKEFALVSAPVGGGSGAAPRREVYRFRDVPGTGPRWRAQWVEALRAGRATPPALAGIGLPGGKGRVVVPASFAAGGPPPLKAEVKPVLALEDGGTGEVDRYGLL